MQTVELSKVTPKHLKYNRTNVFPFSDNTKPEVKREKGNFSITEARH